jgi:carbonic anhydrase
LIVVTCCDHRVDPAHIFGLDLDEAIVIRNAGGRVNPDVVRTLTALATVASIESLVVRVEVVVMHHTDCGTSRFATSDLVPFAADLLGVDPAEVARYRLDDPFESVRVDVDRLRNDPLVPPGTQIAGMVYNVGTGRAELVVPAAPGDR